MTKHTWLGALTLALTAALMPVWAAADPIISPGTPTTTIPAYLTDGTYWFATTLSPLGPAEFLLPINVSDASHLQLWQFDLLFDNTVVQEISPTPDDGSSGIYGAEFTTGNPTSLSFILSGFPFNFIGEIDAVAGEYPSLANGVTGAGVLAYILFQCLDPQTCANPGFQIQNPIVVQGTPEPATLLLVASGLVLLGGRRLRRRELHH